MLTKLYKGNKMITNFNKIKRVSVSNRKQNIKHLEIFGLCTILLLGGNILRDCPNYDK